MSISSCPRCAGQVTLPVGLSNTAVVRCPLCRAQFTLADALVNMPPLLEVVDDSTQGATLDWLTPAESDVESPDSEADTLRLDTLELDQHLSAEETDEDDASHDEVLPLHGDDSPLHGGDETIELEDQELSELSERPEQSGDMTLDFGELEPVSKSDDAESDADVLDFGQSEEEVETEAVEFEAEEAEDELDFGAPDEAAETVAFSAGTPLGKADSENELSFDFGEPNEAAETVEFDAADFDRELGGNVVEGELPFSMEADDTAGDDDQVEAFDAEGLDFGEPIEIEDGAALPMAAMVTPVGAAPVVAVDAAAEAPGGKKKKDKKKKEKKVKVAVANDGTPRRKRSLVGLLGSVLLPGLIAVPIALYGALWLSPAYDFFGVGKMLPAFMLPKGFNKQIAKAPSVPVAVPQEHSVGRPELPPDEPAAEAPATETPTEQPELTEPAATEPAAEMPAEEPAAQTPAGETPAAEAPVEEMPAEDPAAEDVTKTPSGPAVAEPDDPFATPAEPAKETETPAADDPFGEPGEKPATDKPATADPEDLFNTPTEPDAKPAEPAELPAPDEPAATAESVGPRNAKAVPAKEVAAAGQAVMLAGQQLMVAEGAGDDARARKARMSFYLNLFGLAEAITFAEKDASGSLGPQMQAFEQVARQQLGGDPKQRDALRLFAGRWMTFPKRTTNGIALAGKVESAEKIGSLYHAKVKLGAADAEELVTIVSAQDPKLAAGDELLTLGSIVEKPAEELAGYQGDDAAVVWSGMTLKLDGAN